MYSVRERYGSQPRERTAGQQQLIQGYHEDRELYYAKPEDSRLPLALAPSPLPSFV